jgi:hypothetical protein
MVVAGAGQVVVETAAVVVLVTAVAGAVSAWMVVRAARRRLSRWRRARAALQPWGLQPWSLRSWPLRSAGSAMTAVAALPPAQPQWWLVQRDRHRLWRAVTSAERAVTSAKRADAPVGDLPTVARQLRTTANGVDALLRADGARGNARAHLREVLDAAEDIRAAATDALLAFAAPETSGLTDAVRLEVTALRHGLSAH